MKSVICIFGGDFLFGFYPSSQVQRKVVKDQTPLHLYFHLERSALFLIIMVFIRCVPCPLEGVRKEDPQYLNVCLCLTEATVLCTVNHHGGPSCVQ